MMEVIEHKYQVNGRLSSRKRTTKIIIHCSATPEGRDYSVDTIDRWHKQRGFSCIGYHYIIYRDGSIHRGRPKWTVGAHTVGHNSVSIGVCYVGGVATDGKTAKDTRTEAQKESMKELVEVLLRIYGLRPENVYGHRDFAAKACPSFDVRQWRKELAR